MSYFVFLAALLLAAPAAGQSSGVPLMIDERRVVELALTDQPHVSAARAERDAAEQSVLEARRSLAPDVQLSARYGRLSNISARYRTFDGVVYPALRDNVSLRADITVPVSELLTTMAANLRAVGHAARAASIEANIARARTAYEARVAFLAYWRSTLALATASELVHASELQVADQQNREGVGTVARNEVLTFEVALDAAVIAKQSAHSDLAVAEANLRAFFPSMANRPLVIASGSDETGPQPGGAASQRTPPSIAALQAQADAAKERANVASLQRLPKLSLFGIGEVSAPNPRLFVQDELKFVPTWEIGVRLEWGLSQVTLGSAAVKREEANHRALVERVEEARRKLQAERMAAAQQLTLAHERAQRAAARVERASALASARRGELEAGTALSLNVVVAQSDLARAKYERVDAVVEGALALAKLDYLEGRVEAMRVGAVP